MAAEIVIAAYRPKPGRGEELLDLVRRHHPVLRSLGLVTDRVPVIGRAKDGTILEIFEWESNAAMERAHGMPEVRAIWNPMGEIAELASLASLEESKHPFPHFQPVS